MDGPETQYTVVGDAQVAYQIIGTGPLDLLYCYGLGGQIDTFWDSPFAEQVFGSLGAFSRLVLFDRRGTGLSDSVPVNAIPTWEELTEDMTAVWEAAGIERAAIMANLDVGPVAVLFAAMHPELVSALVLTNTSARYLKADDYSIGVPPESVDGVVQMISDTWGTTELAAITNPSRANDPEFLRVSARILRASATPRAATTQYDYMLRNVDVRAALGLVQAPTLVLHVRDNPFIPPAHGMYLAEHIPGARFVEMSGGDLAWISDEDLATIAEFLTGDIPDVEVHRILTTVVFTDIVDSTQRAASMGDQRWRALLDSHDRAVRDQVRRFGGREVNTTGDGFILSFDGPARAIRCARAIRQSTAKLGIQLRIGLHTGECEVRGNDLGGFAVHLAARVSAQAAPDEVLVSGTVKDLVVGSGIDFEDRGEHNLKGVPGTWRLLSVVD